MVFELEAGHRQISAFLNKKEEMEGVKESFGVERSLCKRKEDQNFNK